MDVLDLGEFEAQFGLIIREKDNHDNYALIRFEDLDKIIIYLKVFKEAMKKWVISILPMAQI